MGSGTFWKDIAGWRTVRRRGGEGREGGRGRWLSDARG
jgi:hypothetical protein